MNGRWITAHARRRCDQSPSLAKTRHVDSDRSLSSLSPRGRGCRDATAARRVRGKYLEACPLTRLASLATLSHLISGLPEISTIKWSKSDKSDLEWERVKNRLRGNERKTISLTDTNPRASAAAPKAPCCAWMPASGRCATCCAR